MQASVHFGSNERIRWVSCVNANGGLQWCSLITKWQAVLNGASKFILHVVDPRQLMVDINSVFQEMLPEKPLYGHRSAEYYLVSIRIGISMEKDCLLAVSLVVAFGSL